MKGVIRCHVCILIVVCIQRTSFAFDPLCKNSLLNRKSVSLPDTAFSSSNFELPASQHDGFHPASAGIESVFETHGITAWRSKTLDTHQYVQVDVGTPSLIQSIQTVGCSSSGAIRRCDEYVTKYSIQHSTDGNTWFTLKDGNTERVFSGNSDPHDTVSNKLDCPVIARFVRIRPLAWHNWITLKFDVQGCKIQEAQYFTIAASTRSSTVKGCIGGQGNLSCRGMPDGDYQHCVSCKKYINCSGNILIEFTCPSQLAWDSSMKQCASVSSTCR